MVRIAVLDSDRCRPDDCGIVCIKFCPMVRSDIDAIKIEENERTPTIYESLCSGCGICIRKCPFTAITIVNLASELEKECSHRFGRNLFRLYRLPIPQFGAVVGLLGKNGIGKSTALKILSGEVKPNLGNYDTPPAWEQIIRHYRGSTLQDYFTRLGEVQLKVVHKPQYVDRIPRAVSGETGELLVKADERGKVDEMLRRLQLDTIENRAVEDLSGGELQRLAIAIAYCREADVYLFDEPSSYLDVKQRIEVAKVIRSLRDDGKSVVIAEHDLAVLDYLSDYVCVFYGEPSVYGVVCRPHSVRVGINIFLNGYIPDENVRFRSIPVRFHVKPPIATWNTDDVLLTWSTLEKSYDDFTLTSEAGQAHRGEVIGILGPNGIGKTTFIKLLAGIEEPDIPLSSKIETEVSYKPQYISVDYEGTVETLLRSIAKTDFNTSIYQTEIIHPLNLTRLLDRSVGELSGGELQKTAIAACLSKEAEIYLIDEPSAYLDVEERLAIARTIRRIIENRGVTAFVVEHDVSAQDFIANRIIVFDGVPGIQGHASEPTGLRSGMNAFLKNMGITFRRDPVTKRPRVNKEHSRLDRSQKEQGEYYYLPEGSEEL
ncbi:MAG: ribosome biogenesis/translation initiation ATPase RLI [Candidatus Bathyarchaeota archaeon]|nr:MAG: ribosome biogenesis/translation initiation ATPase RLI [Candidatus Bathyarchaeota archaeon]